MEALFALFEYYEIGSISLCALYHIVPFFGLFFSFLILILILIILLEYVYFLISSKLGIYVFVLISVVFG